MSESTPSGTPADETQHIPSWAAAEPEAQPGAEPRAQPGADAPAVERPLDAATRVDEPVQRVEPMQAVPVPSEATPAVPAGSTVSPVPAVPVSAGAVPLARTSWSMRKTLAVAAAALGIATVGAAGGATAVALSQHDDNQGSGTSQNSQFGPGSGQVDPDGDNWQGGPGRRGGVPPGGLDGQTQTDPNGGSGQTGPNGGTTTPNGGSGTSSRQTPTLPGTAG